MKRFTSSISAILSRREKNRFRVLVTLNLLISVADIASLALLVYIVNFYAQSPGMANPGWLPAWLMNRNSTWLILVFLLVFSIKNYAAWLVNRAQCRFMANVSTRISQKKLLHYLEGDYIDFINEDAAKQLRQISFQPLEFCQHILDGLQQIITQAALILLTITAILIYNAQLFLLLLILLLPPVIIVSWFIKRKLRSARTHTRAASEQSLHHLQEALAGFVESNVYHKNDWFLQRYISRQQQYNRHLAEYLLVQATPGRIIEIFALLGLVVLISLSKWSAGADGTTIVTLGAFIAAAYKIIPGIVRIINISGQMHAYAFTLKDLKDNHVPAANSTTGKIPCIRCISFNNVSFGYNGMPVVKNLSFQLQQGDFLAITGASGKGKTTVVSLLTGFLEPRNGEIIINNATADMPLRKQYRQHIAYVKQQPFIIHDSIVQNIVLDAATDEQKLDTATRLAGLDGLIKQSPEKIITENGKNISGGQRQRIALARAFYKNAGVIILDEPFNELDEQSACRILTQLKNLAASGRIVILITHHTKSLSFCNKTLSLDE